MKKQFLIVGAIAVAAALGYMALQGTRVPPDGTQGAIGAAQKYQSEQIANSDVSLDSPEVAAFLQTDTFHKIATNPEFRQAVTSEAFRSAIGNQAFAAVVSDPGRAKVVAENARLFSNENLSAVAADLSRISKSPGYAEALNSAEFKRIVTASPEAAKVVAEMARTMTPAKAEALMASADWKKWTTESARKGGAQSAAELAKSAGQYSGLMASPEFQKLVRSEAFTSAVSSDGFLTAMASPDLAKIAGNKNVMEMLSSAEAENLVGNKRFAEMLSQADLAKSLANPDVAALLSMGEAAKAFSDPQVIEALKVPGVAELLTNPAMTEALHHSEFLAAAASPDFAKAVAGVATQ